MINRKLNHKLIPVLAVLLTLPCISQAKKTDLISVSADIVEISGSIQSNKGFAWINTVDFAEADIPGILSVGSFQRKTALSTKLNLMESEGKAQILSNPKVVAKSGEQAEISVGGQIPMPTVNNQGVGTELANYGVRLSVRPTMIPERGKIIHLQVNLEVSTPDYSRVVSIGTGTVPSFNNRTMNTVVELNSGETLVIGGLKSSNRNVAEGRVPFLGKIPLIGLLFKSRDVSEDQRSLFLFVTVEVVE
ncbi:pilus assembly protein CpaC [Parelusimicrobium proximum]|uniref:hypothetical protein n=1 Tax=Parelusimicrobium proximum TaxID=3228953 RepID=UPI003D180DFE